MVRQTVLSSVYSLNDIDREAERMVDVDGAGGETQRELDVAGYVRR